jgi:hypothetical protein
MYKKIFFILILLIISIFTIGCSKSNPTIHTTPSSTTTTSNTTTLTETGQAGTIKPDLIVATIQEARTALNTYLANIAQSQSAKTVIADFYNNFQHQETYILTGSTIIEIESDQQLLGTDLDAWEIAYFVSTKNWDLFPEQFNSMFTFEQELVHPASDGTTASYAYTMALRWSIDPSNGDVMTKNQNAQRFETELSK